MVVLKVVEWKLCEKVEVCGKVGECEKVVEWKVGVCGKVEVCEKVGVCEDAEFVEGKWFERIVEKEQGTPYPLLDVSTAEAS